MNQLSQIVEEVIAEREKKGFDETNDLSNDQSGDSGLASSGDSSTQSGKTCELMEHIIIEFKALNERPDSVKESTMLPGGDDLKNGCDLSGIGNNAATATVNSEDGKFRKNCCMI